MRIAQVAPLYESVPPKTYGGTERVVSWLTEELVRLGHDVTLFASADSVTKARLIPCCDRALRLANARDDISPHMLEIERAIGREAGFDVVHFHTGTLHFPLARRMHTKSVTTLHGRLDNPELAPLFREFRDLALVSISDEQRAPVPFASFVATVHHGLPKDLLKFDPDGDGTLAFLGRISPEKRPDRAIRIARAVGLRLVIAAKVASADQNYWEQVIKPLLDEGDGVEFIGEVNEDGKQRLLGKARGMLFPIDWPEPFGLAMIEALACGAPVVAFKCGSVPSVIKHGVTGFVVETMEEAIAATRELHRLSRQACRDDFERRFTVERMAQQYLRVYESLISGARFDAAPMGAP
jgi:glycosyltransferase involved in cell wall biosynthesis